MRGIKAICSDMLHSIIKYQETIHLKTLNKDLYSVLVEYVDSPIFNPIQFKGVLADSRSKQFLYLPEPSGWEFRG